MKVQRLDVRLEQSIIHPRARDSRNTDDIVRAAWRHVEVVIKKATITKLKSKFSKFCTILLPYWVSKLTNLNYKIIYFALEESKEEFIDLLFIMLLAEQGVKTDYAELNSYKKDPPSDRVFDAMESVAKQVDDILSNVIIVDDVFHPTGLYYKCKELAEQWGTLEDSYIPHDPNQHVVVVTDHISLLTPEHDSTLKKTLNKQETIAKWVTHYGLKVITKKFKWAMWNVQQTTMTAEGSDKKKTNTLQPQIEDAANNKEILRDSTAILTLFSPYTHKIPEYRGFNIAKLKDSFRDLGLIKNRFGPSNVNIPLHFNGATGIFKELKLSEQQQYFK